MAKPISSPEAPRAIGPYSQAIDCSAPDGTGPRTVYCSGQIPLDPKTGEMVPGDVGVQTERVLENLRAVLGAAGLDLRHVVKTTVYLADLAEFGRMNEVYGRYFAEDPPARSTVQVAALPRGARIEIDCVAVPSERPIAIRKRTPGREPTEGGEGRHAPS